MKRSRVVQQYFESGNDISSHNTLEIFPTIKDLTELKINIISNMCWNDEGNKQVNSQVYPSSKWHLRNEYLLPTHSTAEASASLWHDRSECTLSTYGTSEASAQMRAVGSLLFIWRLNDFSVK